MHQTLVNVTFRKIFIELSALMTDFIPENQASLGPPAERRMRYKIAIVISHPNQHFKRISAFGIKEI